MIREAYCGHDLEIRSGHPRPIPGLSLHTQVWLDGRVPTAAQPCRDTEDLVHLMDEACNCSDALNA